MAAMIPAANEPAESGVLTPSKVASIVWESAIEAAVNTFLFLLFGRIAVGVVGGVFHDMTPSLPPGLAPQPKAEAEPSTALNATWSTLKEHSFALVFAVLFILTCRARLAAVSPYGDRSRFAVWTQRASTRLSEEWFNLIVWNAFGALISAEILVWVQNFSWTQWVWKGLLEGVQSGIQALAELVLGSGKTHKVKDWYFWYSENQFKFTFWVLYFAAIGDDLGVPNAKTIARRIWRRFRDRGVRDPVAPSADSTTAQPPTG